MRLTIAITTDNDAFQPEAGPEIAAQLRSLADGFDSRDLLPDEWGNLMDLNGNHCGCWIYEEPTE